MYRLFVADSVMDLSTALQSSGLAGEVVPVASWAALAKVVNDSVEADASTPGADEAEEAAVVVLRGGSDGSMSLFEEVARDIESWKTSRRWSLVLVVSDEALGTDGPVVDSGLPAAAIALARSVAITRGTTMRVNVIAASSHLLGASNTQRGPIRDVSVSDVADAARFLASRQSGYVNGQVLFVDGGRQLFSSLSA